MIKKVAQSASESNTCMKFFFDEVQDLVSARYAGCYAARGTKATTSLRMRENMRAKRNGIIIDGDS